MSADIAIVGGGLAGLSAAARLARLGAETVVVEAGPSVGGVATTERVGGFLAERGPHSFADPEPPVRDLLADTGLLERCVQLGSVARTRWIVRAGRLVPAPLTPAAVADSPLFDPEVRARILAEAALPPAAGPGDESVAAFVRRRFGSEAATWLADPLVTGFFAGDPERLSVRYALPRLRELELEHGSLITALARGAVPARRSRSFPEGMQALARGLAAVPGVAVRTGSRVRRISRAAGHFQLDLERGGSLTAQGVVMALPLPLWRGVDLALASPVPVEVLAAQPAPPVALVTLGYPRADVAHDLEGAGFLVPAAEGLPVLGAIFTSSLLPGRAPDGHVTIAVFTGGARNPECADPRVAAPAARTVLQSLLGARSEPVFERITTWPRAIPQPDLGHGARLEILARVERENPGFATTAARRGGSGVPGALAGGCGAADRLLARVAGDA